MIVEFENEAEDALRRSDTFCRVLTGWFIACTVAIAERLLDKGRCPFLFHDPRGLTDSRLRCVPPLGLSFRQVFQLPLFCNIGTCHGRISGRNMLPFGVFCKDEF